MKNHFFSRTRFLSVAIFVFALILIAKLYLVQIVSGENYSHKADRQYTSSNSQLFDRGSIFFTTKDGDLVTAAGLRIGYLIAINPNLITDPEAVYRKLSQIIELNYDDFIAKASKVDDPYEEIADQVESEAVEQISALEIKGVSVHKQRWRFYPGNSLAAHTLGFLAYVDDESAGRYGLERYYEEVLRRDQEGEYVNFFAEMFANIQDTFSADDNREGNIITTIEPTVQTLLEKTLAQVNITYRSEYTGGIIIDPQTGEIIALGIDPSFNLNTFSTEADIQDFANPLVENVYEMGSIIKPLTMAAGLDSGAVTARTTYFDHGFLEVNTRRISNYDGRGRGLVDMQAVLNQSLNTGAAFVMRQMGSEKFSDYMLKYGIGTETGIDLPNETYGLVDNLESPREIEHITASYGQGIAMTPIEAVRALATLANGGVLINPHLVKKINYQIGTSKTVVPNPGKKILKPETAEEISRMLTRVVDEALKGGTVKLEHYSVAAKTGTAQISKGNGGGYYDDRYLHSFFGYFPSYDAKFLVFLYTVDPKEVRYASETLTDSFMDVTKFLINYYEIPPDR